MTRKDLADELNAMAASLEYDTQYDIHISPQMIGRWERGECVMDVIQEDLCIRVLLTNVADIHSINGYTDLDDRLIDDIMMLPSRYKYIMHYLLRRWDGNPLALLEANLGYSALPRRMRSRAIEDLLAVVRSEQDAWNLTDAPMRMNWQYIEREWDKL